MLRWVSTALAPAPWQPGESSLQVPPVFPVLGALPALEFLNLLAKFGNSQINSGIEIRISSFRAQHMLLRHVEVDLTAKKAVLMVGGVIKFHPRF